MAEPTKKYMVEIVDDHPQTATYISEILLYNGYLVREAYNIQDALKIAEQDKPDLIILDFMLGQTNSEEIINKLSKQKIILMDIYGLSRKNVKKYKNIIGFLSKPIDSEKLLEAVGKALK